MFNKSKDHNKEMYAFFLTVSALFTVICMDFFLEIADLNISIRVRESVLCESDPGLSVLQLRDFANIPLQIQRNNSYIFSMLVNLRFVEQWFNFHGSFKTTAVHCHVLYSWEWEKQSYIRHYKQDIRLLGY